MMGRGWLVAPSASTARPCAENFFLTAPSLAQHAALVAMDCTVELDSHLGRMT